ncbi:MAG: hypothetical protein V1646_02595 [bacterium]
MKFFKFCLLFGFMLELFPMLCFGMEEATIPTILDQLKAKDAAQILQPEEFWLLMAATTGADSCFLGESIGTITEDDICLILTYLIAFGQQDKNSFHKCMLECNGHDGISPLNELILRIPETPSQGSEICNLFSILLDVIKTLNPQQRIEILNKEDLYRPCPKIFVRNLGKLYIADAIDKIILEASLQWSPDGNFISIASAGITQPPIGRWDGRHFLSPKPRFSSPGFSSPEPL